jgi:transcription elongation factor GreA
VRSTPSSLADPRSQGNEEAGFRPRTAACGYTAKRGDTFRLVIRRNSLRLNSLDRKAPSNIQWRSLPSRPSEGYNADSNDGAITELIKKKLQEELNTLEHELAFDIPRELKKAAALGDLSENAEYHTAKQRQEYLKARVRQLGQRLADLSLINMSNIPKDKVGLGSTVTIYDSTKQEEMEYKLVTSEESDVTAGKISTTSPIGRALLNKKVGDSAMVVTPGGSREMEILKLFTMHDLAESAAAEIAAAAAKPNVANRA